MRQGCQVVFVVLMLVGNILFFRSDCLTHHSTLNLPFAMAMHIRQYTETKEISNIDIILLLIFSMLSIIKEVKQLIREETEN